MTESFLEDNDSRVQGNKSYKLSEGGSEFGTAGQDIFREESRSTAMVSVHKHRGHNLPCDLHQEHLITT